MDIPTTPTDTPELIEPAADPKPPSKKKKHWKPVSKGIRKDATGYDAYVKVTGVQWNKRFSLRTPLRVIRVWREQTRAQMIDRLVKPEKPTYVPPPVFPPIDRSLKKSPTGWCYLYVIQNGHHVKIGRTLDPAQRLSELQTAHHKTLELVCAVPAHASLERAVHERFAAAKVGDGEWFKLTHEIVWFIDELRAGKNPVALIWN